MLAREQQNHIYLHDWLEQPASTPVRGHVELFPAELAARDVKRDGP